MLALVSALAHLSKFDTSFWTPLFFLLSGAKCGGESSLKKVMSFSQPAYSTPLAGIRKLAVVILTGAHKHHTIARHLYF